MSIFGIENLQKETNSLQLFSQEVRQIPMLREQLKTATDLESLCQIAVNMGEELGYSFTTEEVQVAIAIDAFNTVLTGSSKFNSFLR
ncbi:MAG: Nif11-like leader peptide family natural product precursor [Nostocaceae cyanobacterium]|nr:Nif11-like leader peptide family natural product precursor [Nostocaceae cyanobacterium]